MATKADRNLKEELGPSPHPLFEDREEPWKDHELMLRLQEQHDYQYEIAHVLGCTPSQVSYWMEKAEENWNPDLSESNYECIYFEVCGYESPTPHGICPTCLDLVRHNDSVRDGFELEDAADPLDHIESLYERYDDYEVNSP